MANGWQTMGAVLGGGGQMRQNAYNTGMEMGARTSDLLEQAVERRNKNVAMQAVTADLVQRARGGDPSAQAQLVAGAVQAGVDPRQFTGAAKDQQSIDWGNQSMAEAMKPTGAADINLLNREQLVRSGKPVSMSAVQGGVSLNPFVTPDQNDFTPTDVGEAQIGADNARAGASNASAARQYAGIGADKAANWDIKTNAEGNLVRVNKINGQNEVVTDTKGHPVSASMSGRGVGAAENVAPSVYEATFGKPSIAGGPNAKMQQFQAYRAIHPELDAADALQAFERADQNVPEGTTQLDLGDGIPLNAAQVTANRTGKPVLDTDGKTVLARPVVVGAAPSMGAVVGNGDVPPVPASMAAALNSASGAKPFPGGLSASGDYTPPAASGPAMPKSQSDFAALPKGAQFINPADGRLMVKK